MGLFQPSALQKAEAQSDLHHPPGGLRVRELAKVQGIPDGPVMARILCTKKRHEPSKNIQGVDIIIVIITTIVSIIIISIIIIIIVIIYHYRIFSPSQIAMLGRKCVCVCVYHVFAHHHIFG